MSTKNEKKLACERCDKSVIKTYKIPVKRGKETYIINVCKECFDKEV